MAMDKTSMKNKCKAAIQAIANFPEKGVSPVFIDDRVLEALCQGIIEEIQQNAVVSSAVSVASVTMVTPGLSSSGPGTGTAVGTVA